MNLQKTAQHTFQLPLAGLEEPIFGFWGKDVLVSTQYTVSFSCNSYFVCQINLPWNRTTSPLQFFHHICYSYSALSCSVVNTSHTAVQMPGLFSLFHADLAALLWRNSLWHSLQALPTVQHIVMSLNDVTKPWLEIDWLCSKHDGYIPLYKQPSLPLKYRHFYKHCHHDYCDHTS
jgi:hypothetical protein